MNAPAELLQPGIYTIPAERYHADPAPMPSLSNSLMKHLLRETPRHAWVAHPRLNPTPQEEEGEPKFDIGTAAHSLLLEGVNKAAIIDAKDWKTNAAKEARAAARAKGLIPFLQPQYFATLEMVNAAREYINGNAFLSSVFAAGKPEQTLIWQERHAWCRARLDWLTDDRKVILDYKTTDKDRARFVKGMSENGYDTQAVFYPRGLNALGHAGARFMFLVQEVRAPFLCHLVEPAESLRELGHGKVTRAIRLWADCIASNKWPGYGYDVLQAEATPWALKEEESES